MRYLSFLLLLTIAGCKVGPNYHKPDIAMPQSFVEEKTPGVITDEELYLWWERWNDPILSSLVQEAKNNNFDVRIALQRVLQARSYYRIESSYLAPEIDLVATATRSRYSQNIFTDNTSVESVESGVNTLAPRGSIFGPALQNFFQLGFDAVWELDIFGKLRRGQEAAFDEWEAIQMQAQGVLLTTISEVVRYYVVIRSLQEQMSIIEKKIEVARRNDVLRSLLQQSGLDSQRPVATAAISLQEEMAKLPVLETSYKQNIYALAVLLGKQPESLLSTFIEKAPVPTLLGAVPAGLPSDLLRRRPDIRMAERKLAAATARIGVAVADYFPKISLTGTGYGYESNQQNNWLVPSARYWTIGPAIQWDLLDFGRTRAQVSVANSQEQEALLAYEKTIITSLQDVEGALVAYFDEEKRYEYLIQGKIAAESLCNMTKDLFQAGLVDEMQMLQTLNGVLDQELQCIQSKQALASDMVALYKALGGQWECLAMP